MSHNFGKRLDLKRIGEAMTGQRRRRMLLVLFAIFLIGSILNAQQKSRPTQWDPYRFLVGDWIGEGGGDPGKGSGSFSFAFDLQQTVLVRKNHADYPATNDRAAYSHDDLMIVYFERDSSRAIYFDNEGHIIHYSVESGPGSDSIIFVSDLNPVAPRYRLTYVKVSEDSLKLAFEIAPPGNPAAFTRYIEATAHRKP